MRVDVDVNERIGRSHVVAAGRDLGETATDCQGSLAGSDHCPDEGRRRCPEAAPKRERMCLGKDALSLNRRGDRRLKAFGKADQLARRHRGRPVSKVEQGPAKVLEQIRGGGTVFRFGSALGAGS